MGKTDQKPVIYHNASCSKSRAALAVLVQNNEDFEIVNYLENTPSISTLKAIVQKLNCNPHELVRQTESLYIEKFKDKILTDNEWIVVMHENPILIQRPIVVKGNQAFIPRTPAELTQLETKKANS